MAGFRRMYRRLVKLPFFALLLQGVFFTFSLLGICTFVPLYLWPFDLAESDHRVDPAIIEHIPQTRYRFAF